MIRFGFDLADNTTVDSVVTAMEGHLRKQRNVLSFCLFVYWGFRAQRLLWSLCAAPFCDFGPVLGS